MQRVLNQIYRLPVIGDLLYYGYFVTAWLIFAPLVAILGGAHRLKYGRSVLWMPGVKAERVRQGVELLRARDSEMYSCLTTQQSLIIYYIPPQAKIDRQSDRRVFLMHDRFLEYGAEGVACFLAQSLMIASAVHHINQHKLDDQERAALKAVSRNMVDWLRKHSFDERLIGPYQNYIEKQKRGEGVA